MIIPEPILALYRFLRAFDLRAAMKQIEALTRLWVLYCYSLRHAPIVCFVRSCRGMLIFASAGVKRESGRNHCTFTGAAHYRAWVATVVLTVVAWPCS
jgi:hypothetical protein